MSCEGVSFVVKIFLSIPGPGCAVNNCTPKCSKIHATDKARGGRRGRQAHARARVRVGREPSGVMRRAAYRPFALLLYRNFHITLILLNALHRLAYLPDQPPDCRVQSRNSINRSFSGAEARGQPSQLERVGKFGFCFLVKRLLGADDPPAGTYSSQNLSCAETRLACG